MQTKSELDKNNENSVEIQEDRSASGMQRYARAVYHGSGVSKIRLKLVVDRRYARGSERQTALFHREDVP